MKLSNKLLLLFFISIPVSLFAYNWLLREQFLAGNITEVKYYENDNSNYIREELPEIKHLVIDGELKSGNPNTTEDSINIDWRPNISIENADTGKSMLQIDKLLKDITHSKIKGDTLFVSFYKKERVNSYNLYSRSPIKIRMKNLISLAGEHSNFNINGPFAGQDSTRFLIRSGNLTVNNTNIHTVNLEADSSVNVYIKGNNNIEKLSYSLQKKSELHIENPDGNIGTLQPVNVDSLALISISGKAKDMDKYLHAGN